MGTYAELFAKAGSKIPDDKREEFKERIEKLYQAGGMMDLTHVDLFGVRVKVIRPASVKNNRMNFYYNYFEDDSWENAGVDMGSCNVWSEKIGWQQFNLVVVAAYTQLQRMEFYINTEANREKYLTTEVE